MINSLPAIWAVRAILIPIVPSLAPSIISPLVSTDLNYSFVLESSAFSLIAPEDTHKYTWWELSTLSDFSVIEKDAFSNVTNKTDWTLSGLRTNTTYYVRVRYNGEFTPETAWSNTFIFNTKDVIENSATWIFDDFTGPAGPFENHLTAEGYSWASFQAYRDGFTNNIALDLDGQGNAVSNNALNKSVYNALDVEGVITYSKFSWSDGVVTTPVPESNYYVEVGFHAPAIDTESIGTRRTRIALMARIKSLLDHDQSFVDFALVFSNTELVLWPGGGTGWTGTLTDPTTGQAVVSPILITQLPYDIFVAKDYVFRIEVEGLEARAYLNNIHVATRFLFQETNEFLNQRYVGFNIVSNHEWVIHKSEPLADYFHSDPYTTVPIDDPYIESFEPSALDLKVSYFKAGSLISNRKQHWVYDDFNGPAGSIENHLTAEGYGWAPFQYGDNTKTTSGCLLDLDGQGNARAIVDVLSNNSSWCDGVPLVTLPESDYYAEVSFVAPATSVLDTYRRTRISLMLRIRDLPDPIYGGMGGSYVDYDFVFSENLSINDQNTNLNLALYTGNMGGQITGPAIYLPVLGDGLLRTEFLIDGPELKEYIFRVEVQGAEARAYINGELISTNVIDAIGWGPEILNARHVGFAIISDTQDGTGRTWEPFVHSFKAGPLTDVPRIIFPLSISNLDYDFNLISSPFINFTNTGTHVSSDWELSLSSEFTNLVTSIYNSTINKRTWSLSNLTPGAEYFVRVRYNNSELTSGTWSTAFSFITKVINVDTPSILTPSPSTNVEYDSLTFTSSAFAVTNGTDTHIYSDWEIFTDSGTVVIITKQSLASTTNKVSWTVTGLTPNTTYYVRVRYKGNNLPVSSWSNNFVITTKSPINQPIIISPSTDITISTNSLEIIVSDFVSIGSLADKLDYQRATDLLFTQNIEDRRKAPNATSFVFTNLTLNQTHYFRARYLTLDGTYTPWSLTRTVVVN